MLKKQEVLRDLNIALAVEQAAMAVTMGILAGIYFAASLATFGATATAGVSCTIASAACVAGCALSGVAAVQTQKEINEIKNIIEFESYDEFIEGYKQLENDEEFKLFVNSINGGTFGIKLTAPLISKYVTKLRIVQSSLNRAINRMLFAVDIGASAFRPKQILMNYLISLTEDVNEQRL
jgi:hypothetical protein